MSTSWIPRRGVKRSHPTKKSIYIQVLGAYIDIDESVLQCGACTELLPRDFITMKCRHSTCITCIQKCVKNEEFVCPTCRHTTKTLGYKDPILSEVLRTYPRVVPCGVVCDGCDCSAEHVKSCVACGRVKLDELQAEFDAIKKNNDAMKAKLVMYEDSNGILRQELNRYNVLYGALGDEAESEVESGEIEESETEDN